MARPLDILRENPRLRRLLDHYYSLGSERPKDTWHDRVMESPGLAADELTSLHGQLLAFGWLDARVAIDVYENPSGPARCYKVTPDGLKALRWASDVFGVVPDDDDSELETDFSQSETSPNVIPA